MLINRGKTEEEILRRYEERVLAREEAKEVKQEQRVEPVNIEAQVGDVFILRYDDYGNGLIAKSNELFQGTKAEIPLVDENGRALTGEVQNMYILKRLALVTAIHRNQDLRNLNLWPITALQSEQLLKDGKLAKPDKYWEDLALILYSKDGKNQKEARALYESLKQHRTDLGLSIEDLEERLLVMNAGLEKDGSMQHGVKPIVLPGLIEVYKHGTLQQTGSHKFEYGLEHGLPSVDKLGQGSRTLYMPSGENIGLRVLYRNRDLALDARGEDLVYSNSLGRVNFARQGAKN